MKICSKYKNIETMKITRSGIHETIYHGSYFLLFGERERLKFWNLKCITPLILK